MGMYSASTSYIANSLVMSTDGAKAYLSVKAVPAGTPLTNTEYWKLHIDLSSARESALSAADKANAARAEMLEIARGLTDPVEASGNPVSEVLAGRLPFDGITSSFAPIQAGLGDPCVEGWSRNLIKPTVETVYPGGVTVTRDESGCYTLNGTASATSVAVIGSLSLNAGTYTLSYEEFGGTISSSPTVVQLYDSDAGKIIAYVTPSARSAAYTFAQTTAVYIRVHVYAETVYTNYKIGIQLEAGSTATAYQPYSNIRPISGWSDAKLTRKSKNLIAPTTSTLYPGGVTVSLDKNGCHTLDGTASSTAISVIASMELPAGTYTLSYVEKGGTMSKDATVLQLLDRDAGTIVAYATHDRPYGSCTFDKATAVYVRVHVYSGVKYTGYRIGAQLETGGSATDFEPYDGNDSYAATFTQTIYGGTLDWVTGKLTVTHGGHSFDGTEQISRYDNRFVSQMLDSLINNGEKDVICSHYPLLASGDYRITIGSGTSRLEFWNPAYTTADEFKEYLAAQATAGTPVQIAYKLAKPTTLQLTAQEIAQLRGTNTLYGDGGAITIYGRQRPDTALLKRIEALEGK